ncbi:MAG: thioredoxin fold domain-containing protein, partial [Limisphaerales bacterium]
KGSDQTDEVLTGLTGTLARAKQSGKNVFLLFTGSDWCPSSISLNKQVLTSSTWAELVNPEMITHVCDFPIKKPIYQSVQEENNRLLSSFNVSAYPTQIILSPEGKILARKEGYSPGPISPYISWVLSHTANDNIPQ